MPTSWLETGPDELYSVSGEKKGRRNHDEVIQNLYNTT
jgi:hypothetical protein